MQEEIFNKIEVKEGDENHQIYEEFLRRHNAKCFLLANTNLSEELANMLIEFQIAFHPITEKLPKQKNNIKTKGNQIFTLFDPFLRYEQFINIDYQLPITCIIINSCLSQKNLTLRNNGETHIVVAKLSPSEIYHVALVMEHQLENCKQVWEHKDLAKILLIMRTNLKDTTQKAASMNITINNLKTFGILSSRDNIFLLTMSVTLIPCKVGSNTLLDTRETFGIQYDLSIETFACQQVSDRENFIQTLTTNLNLFQSVKSETKTWSITTSPIFSRSVVSELEKQYNRVMTFQSCAEQKPYKEFGIDNIAEYLKNYFTDHDVGELTTIESDNFEEKIKDSFVVLLSNISPSVRTRLIVIFRIDNHIIGGCYCIKKKITTHLPNQSNAPPGDSSVPPGDPSDDPSNDSDDKTKGKGAGNKNKRKISSNFDIFTLKNKKTKQNIVQEKRSYYYSDNLKPITDQFSINFREVKKIKTSDKIGLYYIIEMQYLKIIHYLNNSSENVKGMNIVKGIEHDNISKIIYFGKQTLNLSQMRELFFEDFTNFSEANKFITLSEKVEDGLEFIQQLLGHSFRDRLIYFVKILLDAIDAVDTLHENDIIHSDISLFNIGFKIFSQQQPLYTKYSKEKSKITEIMSIPYFDLVLLDLNHCNKKKSNQPILEMNLFLIWTNTSFHFPHYLTFQQKNLFNSEKSMMCIVVQY